MGGVEGSDSPSALLHGVQYDVLPTSQGALVFVNLRLFAQFGGPHAQVIVGATNDQMLNARIPFAIDPTQVDLRDSFHAQAE